MFDSDERKGVGEAGNQNATEQSLPRPLSWGTYPTAPIAGYHRHAFPNAATVAALDHDISILRDKLRATLKDDPENYQLIGSLLNFEGRLVRTRGLLQSSRKADWRSYSANMTQGTNHAQEKPRQLRIVCPIKKNFSGRNKWSKSATTEQPRKQNPTLSSCVKIAAIGIFVWAMIRQHVAKS